MAPSDDLYMLPITGYRLEAMVCEYRPMIVRVDV